MIDFDKILDKIIKALAEYQLKGTFVFNIDNLDSIDKVDEIIETVLKNEGYYDNIKEYKAEFSKALAENIQSYKPFGAKLTPELKKFNDISFQNFYSKMSIITETNIKQPIKEALLNYIAEGGKYKDFKATVKELMDRNKIEADTDKIARELTTQYKRSQGRQIAKELNVKYFKFSGSEIPTSRCFCLERKGNIYSMEEIEKWADLEWDGKTKGTNKSNIFSNLGGWGCIDDLIPVTEAIAKKRGFNNYNSVDCEIKKSPKK